MVDLFRVSILSLPLLLSVCVSDVDVYEVEVVLNIPCQPWDDILVNASGGGQFDLQMWRAATGSGCNEGSESACFPLLQRLQADTTCGEQDPISMSFGTFPEVIGVRLVSPDGITAYGFINVTQGGTYTLDLAPGENGDVETPWCSLVAGCVLGDFDAANLACSKGGLETPTGLPATQTPTETGTETETGSPDPSDSPSHTQSPTTTP